MIIEYDLTTLASMVKFDRILNYLISQGVPVGHKWIEPENFSGILIDVRPYKSATVSIPCPHEQAWLDAPALAEAEHAAIEKHRAEVAARRRDERRRRDARMKVIRATCQHDQTHRVWNHDEADYDHVCSCCGEIVGTDCEGFAQAMAHEDLGSQEVA